MAPCVMAPCVMAPGGVTVVCVTCWPVAGIGDDFPPGMAGVCVPGIVGAPAFPGTLGVRVAPGILNDDVVGGDDVDGAGAELNRLKPGNVDAIELILALVWQPVANRQHTMTNEVMLVKKDFID